MSEGENRLIAPVLAVSVRRDGAWKEFPVWPEELGKGARPRPIGKIRCPPGSEFRRFGNDICLVIPAIVDNERVDGLTLTCAEAVYDAKRGRSGLTWEPIE